ncbi:hypothetical protein EPA93_24875 [Ktedonosporobacter rubrisoli]|uniref:Uncharacterized protein n=1 Tax=Ktedonosporobacter rubrisoli TaxID=2509675 RepID=A0A4P6JUQ8_KTERU|nr:hypothetical protein [Ktedonosporobacter rubrisoli]QBD79042.1 hypothetical protein EPA93_24875 [Ktedonosporobacter rubrisoli]
MICARCGFPLTPTRKVCPRCGPDIAEGAAEQVVEQIQGVPHFQQGGFRGGEEEISPGSSTQWEEAGPHFSAPYGAAQSDFFAPVEAGSGYQANSHTPMAFLDTNPPPSFQPPDTGASVSLSQSEQASAAWPSTSTSTPEILNWAQLSHSFGQAQPVEPLAPALAPLPQQFTPKWSTKLGFTVASSCIIAAGLILLFVYFMALNLPRSTPGSGQVSVPTVTTSPSGSPGPSPAITTTPVYPAQQYVDHVQLARAMNTTTIQPTATATTFKTGQLIYVTMNVHPAGQVGAVCLQWFLNDHQFSRYEFSVTPNAQLAYSYTMAKYEGTGYLQVYWASSVACADKQMAQQVHFSVIA